MDWRNKIQVAENICKSYIKGIYKELRLPIRKHYLSFFVFFFKDQKLE